MGPSKCICAQMPGIGEGTGIRLALAKEFVSYQEACVLLGLSWKAFRTLLAEYADALGEQPANTPPRHISVSAFYSLQTIVEKERAGETAEGIRQALRAAVETADTAEEAVESRSEAEPETKQEKENAAASLPADGVTCDIPEGEETVTEVPDLPTLAALVADLTKQVTRLEETLATERHRSVTAIARLQQEIQEIRYAAVTGLSRRDRRRRKPALGLLGHASSGEDGR